MSLTIHQELVMNQIIDALQQGHRRIVLQGSAGVGKTYLVNEFIKRLDRNVSFLTAPTNKALAVLRDKTNRSRNISFSTLHSALKLKRKFNAKTGELEFVQEYNPKYPPFKKCKVLIVDEASMIDNVLLGYLEDYSFPIIFIGDSKQLNPVSLDDSPVFNQHWLTFELTEIIRQGEGNPIIDLSRDISRIWGGKEDIRESSPGSYKGYTYTQDRDKIIERLSEAGGSDELKYLAWKNDEVDSMNLSVRKNIYGQSPKMIEEGEVIVFNTPYGEDYYTNQELHVDSVEVYTDKFPVLGDTTVELKVYRINEEILVVHEDSIKTYRDAAKKLKAETKKGVYSWPTYYKFVEQFADFKYNHAITIHKSQGSTYKDVILNVGDINKNYNSKEKQRLLYTGITRASDLLILYKVKL